MATWHNRWNPKPANLRFFEKVNNAGHCWNWLGTITQNGYGTIVVNKKNILAHRFSYNLLIGKAPEELTIDHLCRNRACVNPNHLEAVTLKVNILRGTGLSAINARKTHCQSGHQLTGDNLAKVKNNESRVCLACRRRYDTLRRRQNGQGERLFRKQILKGDSYGI